MRIALVISLILLFGCDTLNRWQLFGAACKGGEDCERFKKSLREWEEDLKKRPNYEQLVSEEGIDENKNGLRDDVEIYIDDHLETLKGKHWMAKHPFKMYGAIVEHYSNQPVSKLSREQFRKDLINQINCSSAIVRAENLIGNYRSYIIAKIRYLLLNNRKKKSLFDLGYSDSIGGFKLPSNAELMVFSQDYCNVDFKTMQEYKDKIFLWGRNRTKRGLQIELFHFEKSHGNKYRSRYKEYME
ncbi:MAG: hypothetical protein NXH75_02450 [Halobacteriovoraceae bacterium]|nr:hypothetical protein [Halobacteriovoraceae bacterium]